MAKKEILDGKKFGNYLVLSTKYNQGKYRKTMCECICDCGNTKIVDATNLKKGTKSCENCKISPKIDLTGQKFGNYTVSEIDNIDAKGKITWKCICDCGNIRNVVGSTLKNGTSKSCGCYKTSRMDRFKKFCGEMSGSYFCSLKNAANRRKLEFSITKEYIWDLFLTQNRKCALSGEELIFSKNDEDKINQTASLDRIDSSIGYIDGNVQWVHKRVNFMKQALEDSVLVEWCQKIYEHSKKEI